MFRRERGREGAGRAAGEGQGGGRGGRGLPPWAGALRSGGNAAGMDPGERRESGMARDDLAIEASETGGRGRYAAAVEGGTAELTYSRPDPHLMVIDHTYVPRA